MEARQQGETEALPVLEKEVQRASKAAPQPWWAPPRAWEAETQTIRVGGGEQMEGSTTGRHLP